MQTWDEIEVDAWRVGDDVLVRYMEEDRRGVLVDIQPPRRNGTRHAWVTLNGTDGFARYGYRLDELTRIEP